MILSAPDKFSQSLGSVWPEKVRPPHCAAGAGAGAAVGADVGAGAGAGAAVGAGGAGVGRAVGAGAAVYPIYVRQD